MPKRSKPGDDEETSSKKRKLPQEDEHGSNADEVSARPKKKVKETKKEEETTQEKNEPKATPSRGRSKRGAHSKATPSKTEEKLPAASAVEVPAVKAKKIGNLRAENLRIPSHQTPGKHPVGKGPVTEIDNKVTRPPRMRLNLSGEETKTTTEEPEKEEKDTVLNEKIDKKKETKGEQIKHATEKKKEEKPTAEAEPIWTKRGFWIWGMLLAHLVLLRWCGPISNLAMSQYKKVLGVNSESEAVIEREISTAEDEATKRITTQVQLLDYNMARLQKGRDGIFTDLPNHQELFARLSAVTAQVSAPWMDSLEVTIKSIEKLIAEDQALSASTIASIKALLGKDASEYLLDLKHLKLWNISTNLTECGQRDLLTEGRVLDAQRQLLLDLQEDTSQLVNDERVENAIIEWVLDNTAERFERPIEVQSASSSNVPRGSNIDAVRKVIGARMDVATADLTGKVDYAAISSGGAIIKTGKYATTPSIVDTLPYGNRLLHTLRLRFYGHGPEAAIIPTYPLDPSKALGSCWSFVASPSEVGKYAVLSVSLANPIYATQVAIEHPSRDVNDRAKAAIRIFRVVGFETADATGKAWDMGRFEYRLGDDYLQVFDLEEEMGNEDIPAIQSVSLLIDSNWGLGYSCLYRFRVHGHEVEVDQ